MSSVVNKYLKKGNCCNRLRGTVKTTALISQ